MTDLITGDRLAGGPVESIQKGGMWASPRMPAPGTKEAPATANKAAPKIGPKVRLKATRGRPAVYYQRHFQSSILERRIQLEATEPYTDTGGRRVEGKSRWVQFRGGMLRTSDPEAIRAVEKSVDYGLTIWDVDAMREAAKEAAIQTVKQTVLEDKDTFEALMADPDMQERIEAMLVEKKESKPKKE